MNATSAPFWLTVWRRIHAGELRAKPRCASMHGDQQCEKDAGHEKTPGDNGLHQDGNEVWGHV